MSLRLPPASHYEYFSHLFHGGKLIPFNEYQPMENCAYPEFDLKRFETLFLTDPSYYLDRNILDLGCHTGYFSYVTKYLGARSIHGVNARKQPLDIANYVYEQLGQDNYTFDQANIEDLDYLASACVGKDTVMMTLILEHLRNPYAILDTITNSNVNNLIIESTVFSDEGPAGLQYYKQSTESAFLGHDGNKLEAIGALPNVAWFEMILYHMGWKIEFHNVTHGFNKNWFSVPGLKKFPPMTYKSLIILCKKFNNTDRKNNYEK